MWSALTDERTCLPFTIAAGPRQRSHSWISVPRDSWPYLTVSYSRLPHPGGPGPRIYIPQEQGGQVIPLGLGWCAPVFMWMATYIALPYPRRCLLLARIHGHFSWFRNNALVSTSLQLPFLYPWTLLTPSDGLCPRTVSQRRSVCQQVA
jgi:hypothetical protein